MNPLMSLRISYRAIKNNKFRSFLTTLGIIIGVAAVISLVSITQGAKRTIETQLTSLGGNSLIVYTGYRTSSGKKDEKADLKPLTQKDANVIRKLDVVKHVSEIVNTTTNVSNGYQNHFTLIVGASPEFVFINDWFPEKGTFFNNFDIERASLVCVIGKSVKNILFENTDPIGKNLRIGKYTYKIIGVMSSIGQTPSGKDQDDLILMPYSSVQKRLKGTKEVEKISIAVYSPEELDTASNSITKILRQSRNIENNEIDDFYIRSQENQINTIKNVSKIMSVLLGSIASISLIVGGIGIMNIMLVSVGERTREIGIRMAVGAKENDILKQFLVESVVLSLIGGFMGVIIGITISKTASYLTGWATEISLFSILMAFAFAALVGILFGIYPAKKASKLNPIEALRYE